MNLMIYNSKYSFILSHDNQLPHKSDRLPSPDVLSYTILSNTLVRLEWSPVGVAEYYLITSSLNETDHSVIQTNDTSITIEYHEGMIVSVHSINGCHDMESSAFISKHVIASEAGMRIK